MTASPNASLFTYPRFLALNEEGGPLAGGQLFSYQAGTLIPQATYTDATLTVPNPNPIILDSFGTAAVWLGSNAYKFNLLDVNGVQQADFPIDNVTGYAQAALTGSTSVLADLASTAAGQGAGLIGYASSNNYPAGTVGAGLNNSISAASIIAQTGTSFTTGGTGAAYTVTTGQAFTVNAVDRRLNGTTFTAAGIGNPTLAVDTAPALPLVAYNSAGVLAAYLPVLNQISDVQCDGTHWIVMDALGAPVPPKSSRSNLQASTTGSSAVTTISADALTVVNANGQGVTGTSLTLTNNLTAGNVVDGLDTGSPAYSTWYYIWAIYNPTNLAYHTIASLSSTAPTLPSGYTFKALVSAIRTQAATNYYPLGMTQVNDVIQWKVGSGNVPNLPFMASSGGSAVGSVATPTWASIATGAFVPPNAAEIEVGLSVSNGNSSVAMVAPNNTYGAYNSATNPPPLMVNIQATLAYFSVSKWITLESSNIYWASVTGTNTVFTSRFRLNL